MSSSLIIITIASYFAVLFLISFITGRKADNASFFVGNKNSPWFIVAFGMIGASLSGVTFISVPGEVGALISADEPHYKAFSYFQLVLGYLVGYYVIANILMPLYYKLNLVSIYTYLNERFGLYAYKTGASFFIISQTMGASLRLFLAAGVLQIAFFNNYNIPFHITVMVTIVLIWVYTFRSGIKTIVWTDTLQTLFMILSVLLTIFIIGKELDLGFKGIVDTVYNHEYSKVFFWDWHSKKFFFKQFFSGAFIAIVMTGLDQNMMQKNLSCRNLKEAKKNMYWFSITLIPVNLLFLALGVLLYAYSAKMGLQIPNASDDLFPMLAIHEFNTLTGIIFLLGITAAAFSSADSALAALTTSFCIDFLNFEKKDPQKTKRTRLWVHIMFSVLMFFVIIVFKALNNDNVLTAVFKIAGYTYGPLLGIYTFGLFTKYKVKDRFIPFIMILSPLISYLLSENSEQLLGGYKFGFELLILNGLLAFIGLYLISYKYKHDKEG